MPDKIRLENITKRFGNVVAVDDVSASFSEGAYTMILGPSGSGKSTLLRIIAGLETPTEGTVSIDGEDVTDTAPRGRALSMVFQNLALWDHKTVRDNMEFGLKMHGVDKSERQSRVEEIAELLQIETKLDANPTTLSGGEQQRVALGRSLVRQPEVVLLDEPLSSLDERLRLEMRTELKRIQQETETTFIHVTHNQEDSMTVADEILLIDEGEIQQFGPPLDLYHTPRNEFVADFIGSPSMNIFDATFISDEDGPTLELNNDNQLAIPDGWVTYFEERVPEGQVRVGIRPENLIVDGDDDLTIDGTVTIVETFGDYSWYYLETGIIEEFIVQSADEGVMRSLSSGDTVTVSVSPDSIHTFDPATGEAFGTARVTDQTHAMEDERAEESAN